MSVANPPGHLYLLNSYSIQISMWGYKKSEAFQGYNTLTQ